MRPGTLVARVGRLGATCAGVVLVATLLGACSDGDDASVSDITLPSSLSVPTSVPDVAPTTAAPSATTTTTAEVPPTNPAPTGAPVITGLTAEPGADTCTDGSIPAVITFEVRPEPPVRVYSVFLDGAPAGAANDPAPMTVPVPCDGDVHVVLFIATGFDAQSDTKAVSFRTPQAS